jgi:hypothetical protein
MMLGSFTRRHAVAGSLLHYMHHALHASQVNSKAANSASLRVDATALLPAACMLVAATMNSECYCSHCSSNWRERPDTPRLLHRWHLLQRSMCATMSVQQLLLLSLLI